CTPQSRRFSEGAPEAYLWRQRSPGASARGTRTQNGCAMKITSVEAIPVHLPRDRDQSERTAGSPTPLDGQKGVYRWSTVFPALYSIDFETALVRITLDNGLVGWGEAQAPLAPEVACAIIDRLLAAVVRDGEFDGSLECIELLWDR